MSFKLALLWALQVGQEDQMKCSHTRAFLALPFMLCLNYLRNESVFASLDLHLFSFH